MRTILKVQVENFLSFRRETAALNELSVLVGPNGSGKTNFLRIFQFLGEVARRDLVPAINLFEGYDNIRFRGPSPSRRGGGTILAVTGIITEHASLNAPDEYKLNFQERRISDSPSRRVIRRTEEIVFKRTKGRGRRITLSGGRLAFDSAKTRDASTPKEVAVQSTSAGLSMIRKLGNDYGADQVNDIALVFEELRLFEIDVEKARAPSESDDPSRLAHDASNLAAYLAWLSEEYPDIFVRLSEDVRFVLPSFESFKFTKLGGSGNAIRLDILERPLEDFTPLSRASFGTIRAIALFAMLHDPMPPKLTCLEEVDHGLHPHALDRLVERLRDASKRTQLVVATHSPALVNRLHPSELLIFEKDVVSGATRIVDLTPDQIEEMREASGFELGELWFSGTLGGVL